MLQTLETEAPAHTSTSRGQPPLHRPCCCAAAAAAQHTALREARRCKQSAEQSTVLLLLASKQNPQARTGPFAALHSQLALPHTPHSRRREQRQNPAKQSSQQAVTTRLKAGVGITANKTVWHGHNGGHISTGWSHVHKAAGRTVEGQTECTNTHLRDNTCCTSQRYQPAQLKG